MNRIRPVISQIVTFHKEGVLAHYTLLNMMRIRKYSTARKIPIEFILVLDRADELTARIVNHHPLLGERDQVIVVNHGDLASSRNSGIQASRGEYVGTMDGDDYYSENWPVAALNRIRMAQAPVVVHPELCVTFGNIHCISRPIDMSRDRFPLAACLTAHPWVSCSFARKETYIAHPYQPTDVKNTGFGYEDWHWNLEILSHGVRHVCAPETALFYRRKPVSMVTEMAATGAIIRPSTFFNRVNRWTYSTSGRTT